MNWKVFLASAAGRYHLAANAPCQDAGHYAVVDGVLIGVVCDGAGSAAEAQAGSQFFARTVAERLAASIKAREFAQAGEADYREYLAPTIGAARAELGEIAAARRLTLRDFASTLVGCIVSRSGGCFFHVGDGFAIHQNDAGDSILSQPENGEYADETYFVTNEDWHEHLRITSVPEILPGAVIGLMTDGTAPFAVNREKTGFFRPFLNPVVNYLRNAAEQDGSQALLGLLSSEKTLEITSDDKTLLLALAG